MAAGILANGCLGRLLRSEPQEAPWGSMSPSAILGLNRVWGFGLDGCRV